MITWRGENQWVNVVHMSSFGGSSKSFNYLLSEFFTAKIHALDIILKRI